jgi:hypothetical protein
MVTLPYLVVVILQTTPAATTPPVTNEGSHMPTFQKPTAAELRKRLTPQQYEVTQRDATERPFRNEFWNSHAPGIYVDVVSGEPLFSKSSPRPVLT